MSDESAAQEMHEEMPEPPDQATLVDPPKSKVSKIDLKRQKIYQERMQRHIAKGKTPEQANEAIRREDYERLPPNEKINRLERALVGNFQAIAQDIAVLKDNQNSLADVMDVNFRAFEKMLLKLGVPVEEQKAMLQAAEAEIRAERAVPPPPEPVPEEPAPAATEG